MARRPRLNRSALPEVMNLTEVGEAIGSSRDAVRQMVRRGWLRAGRLGRRMYVRKEWLFAALERGGPGQAPDGGPGGAPASGAAA